MTITALKRHLEQSLARLQQNPTRVGRPDLMAAVAERLLRGQASDQQQQARANKVQHALTAFLNHGTVAGTLRHLCWGLTEPLPTGALLTRPQCKALLTEVERALAGGSMTASAWRGLLQGYFTADPATVDGAGRENWLALRGLLARTLPVLQQRMKAMPIWLATILDHAAVLSDNPCAGYAAALLSGDRSDLERLRDDLGIPPQSWFWRETVLAQVRAACAMADGDFHAKLSTVLTALKDYPLLVNDGLKLLLPRYHAAAADSRHDGLCALAVAHWGSPNIFAQAKWAQVSPDVKKMVQVWLAFEDLQTFFEILQADKTVDTRRFQFWLRYHRQMDYVRIALGSQAWHSNDPDLRELRKKGRDRVCRLDGGSGNLNAIIMKIGDFLMVEFSHTGNAAYGYSQINLPFHLNSDAIARDLLSEPAVAVFREPHLGIWEDKYSRILSTKLRIHADSQQRPMPSLTRAPLPPTPPPPPSAPTPIPTKPPLDLAWLRAECRRRSVGLNDHRDKKGALWVRHKEQSDAFGKDLAARGFKFSPGNGWWLK